MTGQPGGARRSVRTLLRSTRIPWMFVAIVVLPSVLAVLYFGLIASDVYVSESHFVVRGPKATTANPLSAMLQGAGSNFSQSAEDSVSVTDFIVSRDALRHLDDEFDLKRVFGAPWIDRINRFAGLDGDDSFEALHRYYQRWVSVGGDSSTPISVLSVRAFRPEDAYRINQRLLELGEHLVNTLNERGRQDLVRYAEDAVRAAESRARAASKAVSVYRRDQAVFDPSQQSQLQLQQIAGLQGTLSSAKARLDQIRGLARDNPQIPALERLLSATQEQIARETGKVAGDVASLASKSVEYEALMLEQTLAEKQLETALASLVQAREDAQRKRLYLERIVQPHLPDQALEPKRIRNIVATIALSMIAWGVISLLSAGVREHLD